MQIKMFSPGIKDKMLKLRGAYQENHILNAKETPKLRFYINRDLETELVVAVSLSLFGFTLMTCIFSV